MSTPPALQQRTIPTPSDAARDVRRGQPDAQLSREEFGARFQQMFYDPTFAQEHDALARLEAMMWNGYEESRKTPRMEKAGERFADPDYDMAVEWKRLSIELVDVERAQRDLTAKRRILLICASPRSEHTCPGEESKTWRLLEAVREEVQGAGMHADVLELNRLTSEYGQRIFPCKGCVSTAMPLCHWPCSCYPNFALAQAPDAMGSIYTQWTAAHGVIIVSPVHWNGAPSVLKLMMDRMVCADGGNPDPTRTQGKKPALAKQLELDGWDYPKHLAGRAFGLVVHGDAEGTQGLRHQLADWLGAMGLVDAGAESQLDRYIGYYEPYATSHRALDRDEAVIEEARNVARAVVRRVTQLQHGQREADEGLESPRQK